MSYEIVTDCVCVCLLSVRALVANGVLHDYVSLRRQIVMLRVLENRLDVCTVSSSMGPCVILLATLALCRAARNTVWQCDSVKLNR